jgi:GNAT superfamily N-acetyltransferase
VVGNDTRRAARAAIRAVLAASCACDEDDFRGDGVIIACAEERAGRLRFPMPSRPLHIVTMGTGVVVSCHPGRARWMRANLGSLGRDAIFSATTLGALTRYVARDGQDLIGPVLRFACTREDLRPVAIPAGVEITHIVQEGIPEFYRHRGFGNALTYRPDTPRPDVLAAVAHRAGTIVGIAGASADSDALWQIGIDVIPAERGAGIGRALVGQLTEAVLEAGKIPYYTSAVSNIASRAVALGLGYWPAWTDMYAKDR